MLERTRARLLVQGITGKQAAFWTERMMEYGTNVVAGVTPGREGHHVHGVPVYDSVEAACRQHAIDATVLFVPPAAAKQATLDAVRSGVGLVVVLAEHVPVQDVLEMMAEADDRGVRIVGPNCPGIVVPGRYFVGIMPAWASSIFQPGPVGVVSRSGSLGTLICLNLVRAGLGQSAFIGVGGDPIVGTTFLDALKYFESDPETRAVVLVGEIGGVMENDAAAFVPTMTKPVVALIAGASAPEEKRMGHAGAIVSGDRGSAAGKIRALSQAGVLVAPVASQVSALVCDALGRPAAVSPSPMGS